MNREQFKSAAGVSDPVADKWYEPTEQAMFQFVIVSPERAACFIATVGHESGGFTRFAENLNYSAEGLLKTFGKYYTPALAEQHARKPEMIANRVYGGRMGNTAPGDGWKYRGRGPIQITGKDNYIQIGLVMGVDLVNNPGLIELPEYGARASAAWWNINGCNELADAGGLLPVSRKVNIGNAYSDKTPNGWADRKQRYERAIKVLG